MLTFFNKKIYFDFEMFNSYTNDSLMFCPNPFGAPSTNEIYRESITLSELEKMHNVEHIHMNYNQFKGFIKEWLNNVQLNAIIKPQQWCESYYKCIKMMSDIVGDELDYTSYNSIFRKRQKWFIDNLDLNEPTEQSPIIFDKPVCPELSWIIADILTSRRDFTYCLYQQEFQKNLQINISKCSEYKNRAKIFDINYINFKEYNNCNDINDLCYLYFPLSGEMVYSNFIFIEQQLKEHLEMKC